MAGLSAGAAGHPGIGNAGGFQMQIEQKDGSYDFREAAERHGQRDRTGQHPVGLANLVTSFRAGAPHVWVDVDRSKAEP